MTTEQMKSLFTLLLIALINIGYSQTEISGKITNKNNQVVPNASVTLLKVADSTVVAYCLGTPDGGYTIYYDGQERELLLCVYGFNIRRQIKKILNTTQVVDFNVIEEAIKLKEVTIKTEKIWGNRDTINYTVDAFRDSTDVVVADVLKKMPGIDV
ncbi:MAG: carboxypeptidase-like regulatory domain-containing protein [Bacteroidales bacterium]|nr:carboxypeptidase-like regulatory domain-containing protein [Bacteroidales bacterium]